MVMQAPEAKSEGAFSILKKILSMNSQISIHDINGKFRIFSYFKSEFNVCCKDFLQKIAKQFVKEERSPYTSTSIKKKGAVLDRLFDEHEVDVDVNYDSNAYSESESEQENIKENEGDDEQDFLLDISDMLSDGEVIDDNQRHIEEDEKMLELPDNSNRIASKKSRKRTIKDLDDIGNPMDSKKRKISHKKYEKKDDDKQANKKRTSKRRSETIVESDKFSEETFTIVTSALKNYFRINRIGQIHKNKLLQQAKKHKNDITIDELENILTYLHENNKIFYIQPMVHQL